MPALGWMNLQENQMNLLELTGYFVRTVSINLKKEIVKSACDAKIYPFFILQNMLESKKPQLVEYGLEILRNLSYRNPEEVVNVIAQNEESCSTSAHTLENVKSGLTRIQEMLRCLLMGSEPKMIGVICEFYANLLRAGEPT